MAGLLDTVYTYRFLKILATKWTDTEAYELGIIDENGTPLKKLKDMNKEEKAAYTPFIRLIFKLKRLMEKIPGGKSATARYGAAILLIKENQEEVEKMGINLDILKKGLERHIMNEEVATGVEGIAGKEQPLGKGKCKCNKKKKKKCTRKKNGNSGGDVVTMNNIRNEEDETKMKYQVIGNAVIRVDELKKVVKKRVVGRKRQKKREYVPTKRRTRTGNRKLRGGKKAKWKRSHKKAYRKAHTGSAQHKRSISMKKRKSYAK
jgi:hypothetical protein